MDGDVLAVNGPVNDVAQTETSTSAPDLVIPAADGNGSGLTIAVVEAVALQQGLAADRGTARSVEDALRRLRRQLGEGQLTDELKQIEYAAAQLRSNLDRAADAAGRIARRLQDDG